MPVKYITPLVFVSLILLSSCASVGSQDRFLSNKWDPVFPQGSFLRGDWDPVTPSGSFLNDDWME